MDLNLTGELWGMPISFIGQMTEESSIEITDWLPSLISIVVVIIGGFITYSSTISIEERKLQYELKKKAYFDVLDVVPKMDEVMKSWDIYWSNYNSLDREMERLQTDRPNYIQKDKVIVERLKESADLLQSYQIKILICANEDVTTSFDKVMNMFKDELKRYDSSNEGKYDTFSDEPYDTFSGILFKELIPAMRNDLMKSKKQWWKFWK